MFLLNIFLSLWSAGKDLLTRLMNAFPMLVLTFSLYGGLNHVTFLRKCGGVIGNSSVDGCWYLFYDVGRVVGLCVDVLRVVVWLSVRAVGTVCKVEGDVQVVNNFHVCLYNYVKSMSLEASCYVFPYSFSLWSGCVFENGESVVSIQTDVIFTVLVAKVVKNEKAN